jgi:hypothetical protein
MKVMAVSTEANLSDLLNKPKATLARLESSRRMLLHRRDAEDLVLTTAGRAEQDSEVASAATRMFAAMMLRDPAVLTLAVEVMPTVFPWVRYLPDDAKREFTAEWLDALSSAASIGNSAAAAVLIAEWRSTAEVYADPELYAALTGPLGGTDFGPLLAPEQVSRDPRAR